MQRHRLPGGKHQALELQGQCYKSQSHQKPRHEKYLHQNDRAQGYRLAITGRCVGQESRRQDLSTW